jgi:hypothetical protein
MIMLPRRNGGGGCDLAGKWREAEEKFFAVEA